MKPHDKGEGGSEMSIIIAWISELILYTWDLVSREPDWEGWE